MRAARYARRGRPRGRFLKWIARFFVTGGVVALLWCVYVLIDADNAQRAARETLEPPSQIAESPTAPAPSPTAPTPSPAPEAPKAPTTLAPGTPLAELSIPRLNLSAAVLHGSDAHTLQLGLGHIEDTPVPGESGNVAIAGHRDSFFRPLRNIKVGDDIVLETPAQQIHYRVASYRVVDSHEVSVIAPTKDATLTLITCYPFWFIGSAPDRFVVRATRVGTPAAPASLSTASPPETKPAAQSKSSTHEPLGGKAVARASETTTFDAPPRIPAVTPAVTPTVTDDKTQVQEAVQRFRLTYNGRLAANGGGSRHERMTFRICDVAVTGKKATATCHSPSPSADVDAPTVWTFALGQAGGEWTITSVGMH